MDSVFDDWLTALNNLQASVSKDLEEIRQQKAEIQQIKMEVFDRVAPGKYLRDDQRIVISAPEIIIGNVDASGMQWGGAGSCIAIRGNQVSLEGMGSDGIVKSRAPHIEQIAVDPGPDGLEEVVQAHSSIVNVAKNIVIQSNESEGYFSASPRQTAGTGIRIHADEHMEIDVSQSVDLRGKEISNRLSDLNAVKSSLTSDSNARMSDVSALISQAKTLLSDQEDLNGDITEISSNMVDMKELQDEFDRLIPALYQSVDSCIRSLSALAETNRRISALEDEQKTVNNMKSSFKDKTTGANLTVCAESMGISSLDGDGNVRTNPEAGISMQTNKVNISTYKEDGSLIDDSMVNIAAHDVNISTVNPKLSDPSSINGDYTTEGSLNIKTKNVSIRAFDYTWDDQGYTVKQLTTDSSFDVRMENINMSAIDTEGKTTGSFAVHADRMKLLSYDAEGAATGNLQIWAKDMELVSSDKDDTATGSITVKAEDISMESVDKDGKALGQVSMNGKNVYVKAVDTDDKGLDKNLASGGNMVLVAENMYFGRTDKDNTSKTLQISSDKTGIYGTTTTEVQQGEAKAVVQLTGGNVAISGSKAEFYGNNTINGKTDFKADATMTKLTVDNLEAKTSLKSKNISDGIAVPGAPSSAQLSAKLSEADAPKPKEKKNDEE